MFKRFLIAGALTLAAALYALAPAPVGAQVQPSTNPTYTPTSILPSQTISATGNSTSFVVNGVGTLYFRIGGSPVGLAATLQITEQRGGTPTFTSVPVENMALGTRVTSVTGTGLYRLNVAGAAQVRLNVSALSSGSFTLAFSGNPSAQQINVLNGVRNTYSAVVKALAVVATGPTDFFTLTGAAGVVTRVTHADCSATTTGTAAVVDLVALTRSTANSAGTAVGAAAHDPSQPAAVATAQSYTANPTAGTLAGTFRIGKLSMQTAASAVIQQVLGWDFGGASRNGSDEIVLRSTAQVFALNGNATNVPATTSYHCNIEWTEE